MKALHRVVQGIFKAAGTFVDSRLTPIRLWCIWFRHCVQVMRVWGGGLGPVAGLGAHAWGCLPSS